MALCFVIYLSTTSREDLSSSGGGLFHLTKVDIADPEPAVSVLCHPHRWYLESKYGGCSCHFRHASVAGAADEIERFQWFGPAEDWCPEDAENVESTAAVYDVITRLVSEGFEVDVVDTWTGTEKDRIRSLHVSLAAVNRDSFRFFENCRFEFRV